MYDLVIVYFAENDLGLVAADAPRLKMNDGLLLVDLMLVVECLDEVVFTAMRT